MAAPKQGEQYRDRQSRETFNVKLVRPEENLVILKEINHGRQIEVLLNKFEQRFEQA